MVKTTGQIHYLHDCYRSKIASETPIYIEGCDEIGGMLFNKCLQNNIYVEGFVDEEVEGSVFGKKVIARQKLPEHAVVARKLSDIFAIDGERIKKNIVIFGAGVNGTTLLRGLKNNCLSGKNITVVDSYKAGMYIDELRIQPVDYLKGRDDCTVIIAMDCYQEAYDSVLKLVGAGQEDNIIVMDKYEIPKNIIYLGDSIESDIVRMSEVLFLCWNKQKKFYLVDDRKNTAKMMELLHNLDIEVKGIIAKEAVEYDGSTGQYMLEDLLYDDDYILLVGRNGAEIVSELNALDIDAGCVECYLGAPLEQRLITTSALEVNLGQSYKSRNTYTGMDRYGQGERKIFTLGGSTTDGVLYGFPSWPELMFQEMKNQNYTVYNGGVWGYGSGQELYRLIQDAIPLGSEIVISYSGVNDMCLGPTYAYNYQRMIYEYAAEHMKIQSIGENCEIHGAEVFKGVPISQTPADAWLDNVLYMHAICEVKHIRYYAFAQPCQYSQEGESRKNLGEFKMSIGTFYANNTEYSKAFRQRVKQASEQYDFIFDLSDIFDGINDVYLDDAHVTEAGNAVIARRILQCLREAGEVL